MRNIVLISMIALCGCKKSSPGISDIALNQGLEIGCSLIIGQIQGVDKTRNSTDERIPFYSYRAKVLKCIIDGDLNPSEIESRTLPLFAGASYGDSLAQGRSYIMFICKDLTYEYCWCCRDDIIDVSGHTGKTIVRKLAGRAQEIYKQTAICRLRSEAIDPNAALSTLPAWLSQTCLNFQAHPKNRNQFAKEIAKSSLGSHIDNSKPFLSYRTYTPPEIRLTKSQVIRLLGQPSVKIGWSYYYSCGKDNQPEEGEYPYGVLVVTFDKSSNVTKLVYDHLRNALK
jgi:hypothetical protein